MLTKCLRFIWILVAARGNLWCTGAWSDQPRPTLWGVWCGSDSKHTPLPAACDSK